MSILSSHLQTAMVDFHKKTIMPTDLQYLQEWYGNKGTSPDFRKRCREYFTGNFGYKNFFLTKSCSQSLELALNICRLEPGSEVILPSFAFVSLANAIALHGLKCIFVDCEKDTMNIDPEVLEQAVSDKTRAVVTINYSGVACDYDKISAICKKYDLILIEDNAHGIRAKYKDQWLGTLGDISTISFDFLKNVSCNEGGGISVNNERLMDAFRISYEFGTNKMDFWENKAQFYEWKQKGSNHALAEQLAAVLCSQLEYSPVIVKEFMRKWKLYYEMLEPLEREGLIRLPKIPAYSQSNGHMFWMKAADHATRDRLMADLKKKNIQTAFHYTPLHSSEYGKTAGEFRGEDKNTTTESGRLLRLPIYFSLKDDELMCVLEQIYSFYRLPFDGI